MYPPGDRTPSALLAAGLTTAEGGLWLDDDRNVGAATTNAGAFVGWVDVLWPDPSRPVRRLRDVVHVPLMEGDEIRAELDRARERREAALQTCRHCERRLIPGHMHSSDICQRCAERQLGVVN